MDVIKKEKTEAKKNLSPALNQGWRFTWGSTAEQNLTHVINAGLEEEEAITW